MGRVAFLATLLVALGGGCVASAEDSADDQPSQACVGEPTQPLTAAELTRALRRHGFTVFQIPGDAICHGPVSDRMPVSVGNVIREGPHDNYGKRDEVTEREATSSAVYGEVRSGVGSSTRISMPRPPRPSSLATRQNFTLRT